MAKVLIQGGGFGGVVAAEHLAKRFLCRVSAGALLRRGRATKIICGPLN